jgi:hypothetical protein
LFVYRKSHKTEIPIISRQHFYFSFPFAGEFKSICFQLCILAIVTLSCKEWLNRSSFENLAGKIPGHEGLPFVGVLHKFFGVKSKGEFEVSMVFHQMLHSHE